MAGTKGKIRVVADNRVPLLQGALEKVAEVTYLPGAEIGPEDVKEADALIVRTRTLCNRELLEDSKVTFIATATIGYDHIDTGWCEQAGITWTNAPGCNSSSVEQYMVSALLWLAVERSFDLSVLTLGVVGAGNVGRKVIRAARTLGMDVLVCDPPRQRAEGPAGFVSLDELLAVSDIITLHVPLEKKGEDATFEMVESGFLSRMKYDSVLINSSRGKVLSEPPVLEAVKKGRLSELILDVFPDEPRISSELLDAASLVTPHIAGYSLDGKSNGTRMSLEALVEHFSLDAAMIEWMEPEKPAQAEILADAGQDDLPVVLKEIYEQCYNIEADNDRLREDPSAFEKLRGSYPFRREAPAYGVRLFQPYGEITKKLEELGFELRSDYCM